MRPGVLPFLTAQDRALVAGRGGVDGEALRTIQHNAELAAAQAKAANDQVVAAAAGDQAERLEVRELRADAATLRAEGNQKFLVACALTVGGVAAFWLFTRGKKQ